VAELTQALGEARLEARVRKKAAGVSLLLLILSLWVTGGDNQKYFSVALNVAISLIVMAYLFIYPAFLRLRSPHRDLDRPFRVPGGAVGAWLVTILATAWSLLATVCLLWPGFGTAHPDDHLPAGFQGQRGQYELLTIAPILAVVAAVATYMFIGPTRSSRVQQQNSEIGLRMVNSQD